MLSVRWFVRVFSSHATSSAEDLFRERDCATIVRPVVDEADLRNIQKLPRAQLQLGAGDLRPDRGCPNLTGRALGLNCLPMRLSATPPDQGLGLGVSGSALVPADAQSLVQGLWGFGIWRCLLVSDAKELRPYESLRPEFREQARSMFPWYSMVA